MKLEAASAVHPRGLRALLKDLGNGESGFGGTPFASYESTIEEFVDACVRAADPTQVRAGRVPQTTFWLLDEDGEAVGMARVRHHLNEGLREHGGHIGFFVRSDRRGRGYGKALMQLALLELRALGETRALITTDEDNARSRSVIGANGGGRARDGSRTESDEPTLRYWIELG